ncbi:MAG: thioredoxin domain-containing protein [Patescibacteria group bacterium]
MQKKKNLPDTSPSFNWQENIKKQQRQDNMKKYGIWLGIIALCVAGLAALVMLATKTSAPITPVEQPNLPKVTSEDIMLGDPKAKVTIIEYADMQCPACATYNSIIDQVLENNKGKVRLVFRFFPLRNLHQNALISAQAVYSANKQGKFSEMKDILFNKQSAWETEKDPRSIFEGYAATIKGMDIEKFMADMNSDGAKNVVLNGEKEAIGLGLNSTPSFFIGNKYIVPKGYDDFQALIDQELK